MRRIANRRAWLVALALLAGSGQAAAADLVLVAGATGGTGQQVVRELNAAGYRVRALVRDPAGARNVLGDGVEYATGDVRQRPTIDAALQGVRYAISAVGAGRKDPANGPEFVDFQGVRNLAEAAAAARLDELVVVSSAGVTREDHPLNRMFDNVLIWKGRGEEAVRASGVPYTIIRPGGL
ncbi:MAG: NAD(P)H-binding protein, partial [Gammaproteobacteria bacterium]|nr:NAD(P)H-binding protein [Gammaproteobacteria bacterium]